MDLRNNKNSLHANITRFTLKATASAILALNAEAAMAAPCPAIIADSALAGMICEFTTGNSVTVVNGGEVGGIVMTGYAAPAPSDIAVNAGGIISNSTGIGITISSSSLSNGLSNSGTINSATGVGILIANSSTISGGISNTGLITSGATSININQSTISGDIFNSGTISSNIHGTGILIANSIITGNISNTGTISGSGNDSGVTVSSNTTVSGDIINSGLINSVTGNALLIDLSSVINGGISNTGTIESTAGLGIDVSVSTVHGDISNSGTINANQQGLSIHNASSAGGIFNSGTISGGTTGLSIFSTTTINGSISNSGIIRGGTAGLSISSTATISGNISNSGTIQGDIAAINISGSTVNNIDILGQSARIIGSVTATETDVNITNGALFTSEGTYDVNAFNIAQNAVFNMANSITVGNGVNNAGTLAIADPLQTIAGNYTQLMGGLFQTDISSVTDYGQLAATGAVNLSESGDIYVQLSQNASLRAGDVFSNVISGNTLTSPINGFKVTDNSYIWTFIPSLNSSNNGVNLTATINSDIYNVCKGRYCQGAAIAIIDQIAAGNSLFSPYATLSTASALQTAASQATPELTNENIQIIQLITRSVVDIVPMWSSLRGRSSGDAMIYQPGKLWIKPYGASMTQNEKNTVQGFDAAAYGAVIGKDIPLTEDSFFGGAFAAGGDNMRGKSVLNGQSINSNAYQGMLYGAKKFSNHIYFAGQGLFGYEFNDTSRSIPLYASTAKGSYNSWFTNIRAETGWSTHLFSPDFLFTPELDASYLYISQNGYRESGSLMDLLVASNSNSSLIVGAYGNGAYHLAAINDQHDLTLTGYAGIAGDVINSQPQVLATFVASGSSFSTFGVQFNEVVFRGGAGLVLTNQTKPLIVELNYDVQVGNNAYSGIGAATIKYKID